MMLAGAADWVPMRWTSADPKSLELERGQSSPQFVKAASEIEVARLGVVRPDTRLCFLL